MIEEINFNTSHVSINPRFFFEIITTLIISIHLMFLLIRLCKIHLANHQSISIHLMFLLIDFPDIPFNPVQVISIHLMFLLIFPATGQPTHPTRISIHLMFLLITDEKGQQWVADVGLLLGGDVHPNFNTSHVSINLTRRRFIYAQRSTFQYISCFY